MFYALEFQAVTRRISSSSTGLTLVELLVTIALTMLTGLLILTLVVFVSKSLLRHSHKSQAQRNALILLARVREEIRPAQRDSIYSQTSWFSLLSWAKDDGSMSWSTYGEILWTQRVVIYYDSDRREVRKHVQKLATPVNYALARLKSFSPTPNDRLLAPDIAEMSCEDSGFGVLLKISAEVGEAHSELRTILMPAASRLGSEATGGH